MCVSRLVESNSASPWTVARQAPLSMDSPGKNLEWVVIPFSRGSLLGIAPGSSALQADSLLSEPQTVVGCGL